MILRAAFWIAVVALLMPHEPNLGFGRPSDAAAAWPGAVLSWVDAAIGSSGKLCQSGCPALEAGADTARSLSLHSIAEARAEIEEAERERARRSE
jgi:hypothetical protein